MKSRTVPDGRRGGSGAKLLDYAGAKLANWGFVVFNLLHSIGNSGTINLWNTSMILGY